MSRVSVRTQKSLIACDAPRCEEKIAAEGSMASLIKRARNAGWSVPQHRGAWHLCPACCAAARDLTNKEAPSALESVEGAFEFGIG